MTEYAVIGIVFLLVVAATAVKSYDKGELDQKNADAAAQLIVQNAGITAFNQQSILDFNQEKTAEAGRQAAQITGQEITDELQHTTASSCELDPVAFGLLRKAIDNANATEPPAPSGGGVPPAGAVARSKG